MALPKLDAPRYELKVPSTGKKATYRPYLVKEEKVLMLALESNDESQMIRAMKDVITACTDGSVDVEKMTMFDLEYIFMQLRGKSVGEKTNIAVKCKSCETKNDVLVNLDKVKIDVPKESARKIALTNTIGVTMKYPSVNDVMAIQTSEDTEVEKLFNLIGACIDSVYSGGEIFDAETQSKQEVRDFIESLNSEQFNKVKDFIQAMPTASITVDFTCSNCSTHNNVEVKGLANFFS
jgi:hypothetical protein